MVGFILVVAVINLALGFAAAVYLGYAYPMWRGRSLASPGDALFLPPFAPLGKSAREAISPERGAPGLSTAEQASPEQGNPAGSSQPAAASSPADSTLSPAVASAPSLAAEESLAAFTIDIATLQSLHAELENYQRQVGESDERLRSYMGTADAAEIEACLKSLMAATNEYLARRAKLSAESSSVVPAPVPATGAEVPATLPPEIQDVLRRQDEQINVTRQQMQAFSPATAEESCHRIVQETGKLLEVNDRVKERVEDTLARAMPEEEKSETSCSVSTLDQLTELPCRAGAETRLWQWWAEDAQRVRRLCAAMLDVDQFGEVNRRYGYRVGNKILREIGQLLKAERLGEGMAARFSGQRFLLLLPDVSPREAATLIEKLRQTIEKSRFRHHGQEIRITVSCAVTEASAADSPEALFARTEATLYEAKRYGRNRTFLHEGKYPTPVIPPNFTGEEKEIEI